MISICENTEELDFLPADPYAARITALADTYGFGRDFAMFWVQSVGSAPVAAVSRIDGNVTVCCKGNADYDELSAFLGAVGWSSITAEKSVLSALGIEPAKESYMVRFVTPAVCNDSVCDSYNPKEIYELLCQCGFDMGDYNAFLADVCLRLNKGTAQLAAFAEDELLACAFKLFIGRKSVLLGAVATRESARGRGLASKVVTSLAASENERSVFLFCREDSLLGFYSKIGFAECGRWAIAEK